MLLSGSTFCFKHLEFLRREVSFMPDLAMLDYFYGDEAEQFTFYRIPKVLFTDPSYRRISSDAKILYGLMLDLSLIHI